MTSRRISISVKLERLSLKPLKNCPLCGVPLVMTGRHYPGSGAQAGLVLYTYYHDKDPEGSPKARRPRPCREWRRARTGRKWDR